MEKYIKRIVEKEIEFYANGIGCAILITGLKWSGKTSIAKKYAKNSIEVYKLKGYTYDFIEDSIKNELSNNQIPLLIDEWQEETKIWDISRKLIDDSQEKGINLILTGSSTPVYRDKIFHSGIGRIFKIKLGTLTFDEIYASDDKVSLTKLFNQDFTHIRTVKRKNNLYDSLERIAYGCWPEIISQGIKNNNYAKQYAEELSSTNFKPVNGLNLNPKLAKIILRSLARLNGGNIEVSNVLKDIGDETSRPTLEKYFDAYYSISLLMDVDSFSINARSKTAIKTKPKVYFSEPSIAASLLNINTPEALLKDKRTLGFLFENLVIKDLSVYAQALNGKLFYYRNKNDYEVDAIIQLDNRQWAAIEIKTGIDELEKAARNLLSLTDKMTPDDTIDNKPTFLMIICGAIESPYCREDGVLVVPPTLLGL